MIKKIFSVILVAAVAVSLCACSGDGGKSSSSSSTPNINAQVSSTPEESTPAPTKNVDVAIISDDGVNIRAGATTDDEILTQASKGDAFYLVEKDTAEGWHKIEYDGKDAYVSADYSSISSLTEAEAKSKVEGDTTGDETEPTPAPDDSGSSGSENSENSDNSDSSSSSEGSGSSSSEDSRSKEDGQRR